VWSAYGLGLFVLAQLAVLVIAIARSHGAIATQGELMSAFVILLLLASVFLLAGRSLANTGGRSGNPVAWIVTAAVLTLPWIFLQPFVIPTAGMEGTLLVGDRILVHRFPKPSIHRGELIAFSYPVDRRQSFVKRVIGVQGDRIRIANKVVYRNGQPMNEPYASNRTEFIDTYRDNFPSQPYLQLASQGKDMLEQHVQNGEVVVPEGSYFVLGDNRDNSLDSRYWGFVPASDLIGKPVLIYGSMTERGTGDSAWLAWPRIRWNRLFKSV
jgi:signal peptidase I